MRIDPHRARSACKRSPPLSDTRGPVSKGTGPFCFSARPSSRHRHCAGLFVNNLPQARHRYWPEGALQKKKKRMRGCTTPAIRHFGCAYAPPPAKPKVRAGGMCTGSHPMCSEKARRLAGARAWTQPKWKLEKSCSSSWPRTPVFHTGDRGFESRTRRQNPSLVALTRRA